MSWETAFITMETAVCVLTFFLFVRRVGLSVRQQARWTMVLLLCLSKFLCFRELGGSAFVPDFPDWLIWAWDWAYSGAMILFALSVLFFFRFRHKVWLLPLAAWTLASWGLWNGVSAPDAHEIELSFPNLPPALEGYRIAHLSDLHCSSAARRWRTQAVVDCVNAQKPDLICLTGDLVDGRFEKRADDMAPLAGLRARDGVCACTGNHEYYCGFDVWQSLFYGPQANIRFLDNACAFPRPGLAVAGVPDPAGARYGRDEMPDVRQAFAAATNGEFRVLLEHRPKNAETNVREVGVDLQLSGHTHGGIAPILNLIVAPYNAGFTRGVYRLDASVLHVSPGCGQWAGFPVRFFNPAEVTVIRLTRSPDGSSAP